MIAPLLLVATIIALMIPMLPDETWAGQSIAAHPPVIVLASSPETGHQDDPFLARASLEVVNRTVDRLKADGIRLHVEGPGRYAIGESVSVVFPVSGGSSSLSQPPSGVGPVTLTVEFATGSTPHASGTETRFAGEGNESWRLASAVQRHLVGGMRDVLGYQSYDRGVVEYPAQDDAPDTDLGQTSPGRWVLSRPLFFTNPAERELLTWPETLDLIAAALANAIRDHLDASIETPPKSAAEGWRVKTPWRPVTPRVITRGEGPPLVALTFDGGSSSVPTPAILQALREQGIRATMFITGNFVQRNPDLVVQMARDGHEFGNHSSTHRDMTRLSAEEIVQELEEVETAVQALTGKSTRPWFRPPFGAYNRHLVETAAVQGYYTVMWSADSADWRPEATLALVEQRILANSSPGAVLIQHLGSPQSADVLPRLLRQLRARGTGFGTLSEVLGPLE